LDKNKIPILKSTEPKLKQVLFVVMQPDIVDGHGDITTEEEVRKACHSYNLTCNKANLFHLAETETFAAVESYITPVDLQIGERFVTKGSWLANLQIYDDDLWSAIESGEVNGVSIGAMADTEKITE
jgi:Putative phage serine protease XkdF